MLKSAFLLLFLLNSLQTSMANLTIEELTKASLELLNKKLMLDDAKEQFKNMSIHGAKIYMANEKINALDEIPLQSGWINKTHVELCSGFPALRESNSYQLSSYNSTFLIQYESFEKVLSTIPNSEVDIKKLKTVFYQVSDEKRQVEVAHEVHEFSQRLQCLQILKSSNNEEFIEKMTDLYEVYCYAEKFSQERQSKEDEESCLSIGIIVLVVIFIVLCACLCWYSV